MIITTLKHGLLQSRFVLICMLFVAGIAVNAAPAHGAGLFDRFREGFNVTADAAYQDLKPAPLNVQIITYINFLLALIGIVFLGLMLYAGWTLLMARGNEDQIEKSKTTIRHSIIGFLAILIARIFTEFVVINLLTALSNS